MSLLSDYDHDTAWKYERLSGCFHTGDGLERKVGDDGRIRFFPGSTAVFRLDGKSIRVLSMMRADLRRELDASGMMAETALPEESFHLTLHDLISPDKTGSARVFADEACTSCTEEYQSEVRGSLKAALEIVEAVRRDYAGSVIHLASDRVVNMVSKSAVLLLRPCTEEDYSLLMELFGCFQPLVPLKSFLPHITLDYFRPGELDGEALQAAFNVIHSRLPEGSVRFDLPVTALTAQYFRDMVSYEDVPRRVCFVCDGGLNRSVMAAAVLNHLAREEGLALRAEARAAFAGTEGCPVSDEVWRTLRLRGIEPDSRLASARMLKDSDISSFTAFSAISQGAKSQMRLLHIPEERFEPLTEQMLGVPDPEYTREFEEAYRQTEERVRRVLEILKASSLIDSDWFLPA